jgi:hypothetical protein
MASDIGEGDSETATLLVSPADGTTQATLTVTAPDGTTRSYTASGGPLNPIDGSSDTQQLWTTDQPVLYDQAGHWVLHWDVTNTGEGVEDLDVYVVRSPVAGGPTWLPGRSRVAAYVPHRTLARSVDTSTESAETYQFTFDSTTIPTGVVVDRLIADGSAWVSALVTPLNVKSEPLAALIAALWAAIATERSWPDDETSLQRANDMEKQLNSMLTALKQSNLDANTGTDEGFDIAYPAWSFPRADLRWDSPRYW